MRSGDLKHGIVIERATKTSDGIGGYTDTWSDYYSCRAAIWPMRASEILDAMKLELNVNHRIRIRHPRRNITADMRIKWFDQIAEENKYFNIVSIINADKKNVMLEFLAIEDV
ncbi:MAG: phage head closure protein [FCB group bacterium]|nr:phage head closure protein [FCB group bacterium]